MLPNLEYAGDVVKMESTPVIYPVVEEIVPCWEGLSNGLAGAG